MKNPVLVSLLIFLAGCNTGSPESVDKRHGDGTDMIFHYSVLKALDNGVLEGNMSVGELKQYTDIGLGTYNCLDGELIAAGGEIYQVRADGRVIVPDDNTLVPYAVICTFSEDGHIRMEKGIDYPLLKERLEAELPSLNLFYAVVAKGDFEYIKVGGANRQERPYDKSIAEMLEGRPVFEAENISGMLVGFWCPEYIGDINTDGLHLHFLSEDLGMGGHLLEFRASLLDISYDAKTAYKFVLPQTEDMLHAKFRPEAVNY